MSDRRRNFCCLGTVGVLMVLCVAGCHRDMRDQPRYEAQEESAFFANGQSDRPLIAGTVARGQLDADDEVHTGKVDGRFSKQIPIPVDRALLERGHERFNIYCAPCHDRTGKGDGIIVQRGFRLPPTFHQDRLRQAPDGHYFDVMTNGFGVMPRYAVQLTPQDRWAIVAYIRALQLSRNSPLKEVPAEIREQLIKERP
jgi:mono/diheme cytochrome c family protein